MLDREDRPQRISVPNGSARDARAVAGKHAAAAAGPRRPSHARPEAPRDARYERGQVMLGAGGSLVSAPTGRLRKAALLVGAVLVAAAAAWLLLRGSLASGSTATSQDAVASDMVLTESEPQAASAGASAQGDAVVEVAPGQSPDHVQGFADHRRRAIGEFGDFGDRGPQGAGSCESLEPGQTLASLGLTGASVQVPELFQYPSMPAGCEVYSLAAVLSAIGQDADPDAIVADQLPFEAEGDDYATAFWGDPYSAGEGMPPAIMIAGNAVLEQAGASERFDNATGTDFDDLAAKATSGSPVLVWTTLGFEDPGFDEPLEANSFYDLEHCVVLLGVSNGRACVMDPTQGYVTVDYGWFKHLYEQCGSMALSLA